MCMDISFVDKFQIWTQNALKEFGKRKIYGVLIHLAEVLGKFSFIVGCRRIYGLNKSFMYIFA